MLKDSVFGYKKGMTIDEINAVSEKPAIPANELTDKLLEVFPVNKDFDLFSSYNIRLDEEKKADELFLRMTDIDYSNLVEQLRYVYSAITDNYGSSNQDLSSSVDILTYDPIKLKEELNKDPDRGFNFYWDSLIKPEYQNVIETIKLTVKADIKNLGFLCVNFILKDNIAVNNESEEPVDESDLLDDDEAPTVYENEVAYEQSTEDNKTSTTTINQEEPSVFTEESKDEPSIPKPQGNNKQDKFGISKKNLIWYFFMLVMWLYFLVPPFINVCTGDQKGKIFNFIYYIGYFAYTVFACYLPFHIKKALNKFAATEESERKALTSGEQINTESHGIWKAYKSTFFKNDFGIQNKTRASADLYFNYDSVANIMAPKLSVVGTFKMIAPSFMGLGILGTFIGFSIGLRNITHLGADESSALMGDVKNLIENGLSTAFNTSIVGVFCSLIYSFLIYNPLILKFNKYFEDLCDSLDQEFYVSETEALMQYTMLTDENANNIPFSQSLRFIVENMNKQTDALNNFNDNLADKISNMNESVNTALNHIATGVGTEVKEAVIANVHLELDGLKLSLTDAAKQLAMVAEKILETPELLEKANSELKQYLEDTRTSFTEMLNENLDANRTALNEVVETIQNELTKNFADFSKSLTKALSSSQKAAELLDNIPGKIEQIETSFSEQEADVASRFETAAGKLTEVSNSVNEYLESVEKGITGILNDLTSAEENVKELLAAAKINEDNSGKNLTAVIEQTNTMLEGFRKVDVSLKNIFEDIGNEIVKYNTTVDSTLRQYLSSFEDGSTSFANSIHGSVQEFEDTLNDLSTNLNAVQQTSKSFDDSITKLGKIMTSKIQQPKQNK